MFLLEAHRCLYYDFVQRRDFVQTSETIHPEKNGNQTQVTGHTELGVMRNFEVLKQHFLFFYDCANVSIAFLKNSCVRVKVSTKDISIEDTTVAVVGAEYLATADVSVSDNEADVVLSAPGLQLTLGKTEFSLRLETSSGETLFRTKDLRLDGKGAFTLSNHAERHAHFYGLGEKTGFLDKRGERYEMWNSDVYAPHVPEIEALYTSIPFLIHFTPEQSYGIFLDNPGKTVFDMRGQTDAYTLSTATGDLDVYFLYGPTLKNVLERYTSLTGRAQLPPKWALGYHQSRYSYMNEEEVLDLAKNFRQKNIPCDVIHLDIHYMNEYRVFTFDRARFPNPHRMMQELSESGFHVVPIVDPGVKRDPKYHAYREGIENDFFCKKIEGTLFTGEVWPGESAFPDFTENRVAKWWGAKHKFYTDLGIRGIWNDMNEPAIFNESKTMDLDVIHRNNGDVKTHEELHNLYGLLMSKATYEGMAEHLNGERPFILTRASYAGVQRYAAVWTGDNRSFWEHLQMAIPMVMNLGLSGVPFSGPDIGGFAHHTSGELLARWSQVGALFPFCRNHSALDTVRQEPWSFGPEIEEIVRKYVQLRYSWMPYLYSLFFESTQSGLPVMRPLVLEYPHDANVTNLSDEFLLGSHVLVAPITRPDTEYRAVYLPEGTWFDYWTGKRYEGNQHILAHAPIDVLPMYIRAGSILPHHSAPIQHAGEYESAELTFSVYLGGAGTTGSFRVYEDDGLTFAHKEGEYNLFDVQAKEADSTVTFSYHYVTRGFSPAHTSRGEVRLVGLDSAPRAVVGLEASETWSYESESKTLLLTIDLQNDHREVLIHKA